MSDHEPKFKSAKHQRPSRRSFLTTSAGACGALALWSLRPANRAFAASGKTTTPGMVTIVQFGANGKKTGKVVVPKVVKSDAEWQQLLSPISYQVARQAGTERAYTGDTLNVHDRGLFRCICCDTAVFSSETKFDSGTGWPSFWQPIARENVVEIDRPKRRDGAHCGLLQTVRRSFGPRVHGWAASDGSALLHELGGHALRQAGLGASYNRPMSTVNEHYERLLSQHYTWMFGVSFEDRVSEQKVLSFTCTGASSLQHGRTALAVDLGCGPGFQTIALASLGFRR